jgi:hypothetical protein
MAPPFPRHAATQSTVREFVLTSEDHLLRFGRELVIPHYTLPEIKVTVLNNAGPTSPEAEFTDGGPAISRHS